MQIEFWQAVALLLSFLGCAAGAARALLAQSQKHLDERFATQEKTRATQEEALDRRLQSIESFSREEAGQWQRVERELLRFQAELPVKYVMRDDYVRGQSIIEAKLDGLADKLEKAQLRGIIQGGRA